MKVADAIAQILKAEGVEYLFAYPVNPIIEAAARIGIRRLWFGRNALGFTWPMPSAG